MDDELRVALYRQMVRIRTYEEALQREYLADKLPAFDIGAGAIPGELHLAAGQEPVAAGVCARLRPGDAVTAAHRPHHLALAHGVDIERMTAEIFGRETGLCRGKGGHMHLYDPSTHFSASAIIAEGAPVAVGQALAFTRRGTDQVAVAVVGEGATNQGGFHEAVNLAALWRLPVVFVVEDNNWAVSVQRSVSTPVRDNAVRAVAYGIPGAHVGNDVEDIHAAAGEAVVRAREGEGPTLLEIETVRLFGHFEGDTQEYRGGELAEAVARDPIPAYEAALRARGVLDDAAVESTRRQASDEVEAAIAFAKAAPAPAPAAAYDHVFV